MKTTSLASVLALLTTCSCCVFAQPPDIEWEMTSANALTSSWIEVRQISDGGFACAGYQQAYPSASTNDWYFTKLTPQGSTSAEHTYGTSSTDNCISFAETHSGGFVLCGYGNGMFINAMTILTDSEGDSLSGHTYASHGFDGFTDIQRTSDGGFIICGFRGTGSIPRDPWLVKLNANGDSVWSRIYASSGDEWTGGVTQTDDGGYVIAGESAATVGGNYDAAILRTDSTGNIVWYRFYGDSGRDAAASILSTEDGGFIIAGLFETPNDDGDFWLLALNSNGDSLWNRTYNFRGRDWCHAFCRAPGGGYLLAGTSDMLSDTVTYSIGRLLRVAENGDSLWSMSFYGHHLADLQSVYPTTDDGYVACGKKDTPDDALSKAWAFKLMPDQTQVVEPHRIVDQKMFQLGQNYPNPFNSTTQIDFALPAAQRVSLRIYDVLGREVRTLINGIQAAGNHRVTFDASELSSGIYLCRMQAGEFTQTRKLMLLK
jgi:hypothetical protein